MHAATLNLKVDVANTDSLELLDELDSILYTNELLTQYFTSLFSELSKRGGGEVKGIHKTVFIDVFFV